MLKLEIFFSYNPCCLHQIHSIGMTDYKLSGYIAPSTSSSNESTTYLPCIVALRFGNTESILSFNLDA